MIRVSSDDGAHSGPEHRPRSFRCMMFVHPRYTWPHRAFCQLWMNAAMSAFIMIYYIATLPCEAKTLLITFPTRGISLLEYHHFAMDSSYNCVENDIKHKRGMNFGEIEIISAIMHQKPANPGFTTLIRASHARFCPIWCNACTLVSSVSINPKLTLLLSNII